ncbi:MAG: anti-sigma factor antagonist [Oscillospiraceae bacterium]|nr:anti-sigma factor antagonist [Oscillospiraceae bacterium]
MVRFLLKDDKLLAALSGEIDHHSSKLMREKIDMSIREHTPSQLILDFENVTFMDSSGVGLVIGRYKLIHDLNGKVIIRNASEQTKKILRMSGIESLASIQ